MVGYLHNRKDSDGCVLEEVNGSAKVVIRPEQYLSVKVSDVWVPVLIRYSREKQTWHFAGLPHIAIDGKMVRTYK